MNTYYFSVQRQLPGQFTLVGYVGNNANNLIIINDLNQARPNAIGENANVENRRPNLAFSSVAATLPYGYSNYNSLQVKLEKRSSNGLYFLNSFTWSKALDVAFQAFDNSNGNGTAVQDINNVNADYGISNDHRPINNITSLTYQIPVGRGRRFSPTLRACLISLLAAGVSTPSSTRARVSPCLSPTPPTRSIRWFRSSQCSVAMPTGQTSMARPLCRTQPVLRANISTARTSPCLSTMHPSATLAATPSAGMLITPPIWAFQRICRHRAGSHSLSQ